MHSLSLIQQKKSALNLKSETVIYIDNSFSMQAKGNQGELLKRAVQDIISNVPEEENISLITNENIYRNTSINAIKNELLALNYSSKTWSYDAALLKCKKLFKPSTPVKNIIFVSDFQEQQNNFNPEYDSLYNIHAVKLMPVNNNNVSIDSAYISNTTANAMELKVVIRNNGAFIGNLPVSLFNNDTLIAKTSVAINKDTVASFLMPVNNIINGKIIIKDTGLQYDNSLFFNINKLSKIKVLTINNSDDTFLKRIYTNDEFSFTSSVLNQVNYNIINEQHLIILNELNSLPNSLINILKSFTLQGGFVLIIPSNNIDMETYDTFLLNFNTSFTNFVTGEKRITTINYSHPIYANGVFEKRVTNFQYPKVDSFYSTSNNKGLEILLYEDNRVFLYENKHAYIFTAALNSSNSNFKNSPLIVPTLYNIGKFSLNNPNLYFIIGDNNTFDVSVNLSQDDILSLVSNDVNMIPKQQYYNNKVTITTTDEPSVSNTYSVNNKNMNLQNVSYNYNRNESQLIYQDLSKLKNITLNNSVTDIFNILKSDTKVNNLWKWFVIFALAFLIIEMLILKYFK
ncbi:hypothetical protein [Yeosuana sp.]|uniref:hypothetical protein n=1 Tax=Yeosuana sp. TaxID=2529388 RepID=UPI004054C022